jgi:hypothetical protein
VVILGTPQDPLSDEAGDVIQLFGGQFLPKASDLFSFALFFHPAYLNKKGNPDARYLVEIARK